MASFPGLYRAKASKRDGTTLVSFVPQVFGNVPVTIRDFVGAAPSSQEMGWVGFQGGDPEFPVWFGVTASGNGGPPNWPDGYPTYDERYVNIDGDEMTGDLEVFGRITAADQLIAGFDVVIGAATPTSGNHAARKDYVDAQVATRLDQTTADTRYVNVSGDTMTGVLNFNSATGTINFRGAGGTPTYGAIGNTTTEFYLSTFSTSTPINFKVNSVTKLAISNTGVQALVDVIVPDEGYGPGWNGSTEVPTKNAVYDKVEALNVTFVNVTGDQMTGALTMAATGAPDQIIPRHTAPLLALENADGSTRYSYLQATTTQTRLTVDAGDIHLQSINGIAILAGKTDVKLYMDDAFGAAIHGWFGFQNTIILPRNSDSGDLEGLLFGKGFRFEIGIESGSEFHVDSFGVKKFSVDNSGFVTATARRWRANRASTSVGTGDNNHTGTLTVLENVGGYTGAGTNASPLVLPVTGSYTFTLLFNGASFTAAAPSNLSAAILGIAGLTYMIPLLPGTGHRVGGTLHLYATSGTSVTFSLRNGTGAAVTCAMEMEVLKVA